MKKITVTEKLSKLPLKNRDSAIDIVKGMGIFFMVGVHCGAFFTNFIYLFHMAIFFIASGYLYKEKYTENFSNLKLFIKKKIKSLYFPYVLWMLIYSVLHNSFIRINIYTDNPEITKYISGTYIGTTSAYTTQELLIKIVQNFFLFGNEQLAGAFWFISALFKLSVMYAVFDFILCRFLQTKNRDIIQLILSVLFLGLGYYCQLSNRTFLQFDISLSCYILFYLGHILNKKKEIVQFDSKVVNLIICTASFAILMILQNFGSISLNKNFYSNPLYLIIVSIAGWEFLYSLSFFIKKTKILKNLLMLCSQNSMAIVILHFLAFKIINLLQVFMKHQPLFLIAAFPTLYTYSFWWVAYLFTGLFIPVLLNIIYKRIKLFFTQRLCLK